MRELERDKERLLHIMEAIDTIVGIPKQRNLSDLSLLARIKNPSLFIIRISNLPTYYTLFIMNCLK